MSPRRLLDTNLIVRYLVQDRARHAKIATALFEACDRGEIILIILAPVLAECVFVLESFYKHSRHDIAITLSQLVSSPGIEMSDEAIHLDALARYEKSKAHFIDCIVAAHAAARKIPVATFDTDFRKFGDVSVDVS